MYDKEQVIFFPCLYTIKDLKKISFIGWKITICILIL